MNTLPKNAANKLHSLSDSELKRELRRLNGTPNEVLDNPALMQLVLPFLRADLAISETYVYRGGARLNCPITVFGGLREGVISRDLLDPWKEHTNTSFAIKMLPGGHFFVHTAQYLLLRVISREVTRAMSPHRSKTPAIESN